MTNQQPWLTLHQLFLIMSSSSLVVVIFCAAELAVGTLRSA
jgi:hypothetical protein